MATYVHIADARDVAAIRRNGLVLPKARFRQYEHERYRYGVFAMPVISDFMLTHQWVRELAKRGYRSSVGVYFHLPDDEPVWAGLFNAEKAKATAASAASRLREERLLGYEVIVPRSISASEIRTVRELPRVGWRFFPGAKGNAPRCLCKYCVGGEINSRRMRDRLDPAGTYA